MKGKMHALMHTLMLGVLLSSCLAQEDNLQPARLPPVVVDGENRSSCLAEALRENTKRAIIWNAINGEQYCPCGGPGAWRKIAHLDMSDPNQQCPTNLRFVTTPIRACGQSSIGRSVCDSAIFPANNQRYSRVCGRIRAYLKGHLFAFYNYNLAGHTTLDDAYVDGISLVHGAPGARQHIWSFAVSYAGGSWGDSPSYHCPCTDSDGTWPYRIPSFIGNGYFCDTPYTRPASQDGNTVYLDDPLWDGIGCGPASTCCQFNSLPWFCTTLPQSTRDDIELKTCNWELTNGDTLIELVEIYVM